MERPTVRQLEYVVAVADHGHFGRAAEAAGVSQPGLSAQIRDVERRLDVALFERTTRSVRPTPAGETVATWARSVLLSIDEMVLAAQQQSGLSGRVAVGAIPTMAPYLLPDLVARIRADWPDARLELVERQSSDLVSDIEQGQLEAAEEQHVRVVAGLGELAKDGLVVRREAWQSGTPLEPPAEPLDEAGRAARWLLERLAA